MGDVFNWGALGAAAITQGITFLFGQAGELLKWRRERAAGEPDQKPVTLELPEALGGGSAAAVAELQLVDGHLEALQRLRASLLEYAEGQAVPADDAAVLADVDELRTILEDVLGTHLTFVGEARPSSGVPVVSGRVEAQRIRHSSAVGVDAEEVAEGTVRGVVEVDEADDGSQLTGVRIGRIGRRHSPRPPSD